MTMPDVLVVWALGCNEGCVVTYAAIDVGLGDGVRAGALHRVILRTQFCAGWDKGPGVEERR